MTGQSTRESLGGGGPKKGSVGGNSGGGGGGGGVSDAETSEAMNGSERDYDFADDEDSDGDEEDEEEDEEEEEDIMEDTEEEEEEMRSSEEEALDELHLLQERKALYEQSKKKQRQLIEKYFESIEKLKKVRMKNMYLQDRIHQHLVDKAKILAECREAVKLRKDMINKLEAEVTRPQMTHYQFETLQRDLDRQACEGKWERIEEELESSGEEEEEEESPGVIRDDSYRRLKLCKRRAKEYRKKHEKGLSKLERLSLDHYHFEKLHDHDEKRRRKEEQLEKERLLAIEAEQEAEAARENTIEEPATATVSDRPHSNSDRPSIASFKLSLELLREAEHIKEIQNAKPEPLPDLEKLHQEEIRSEKYLDADDEWKYKHEKDRLEHRKLAEQHKLEAAHNAHKRPSARHSEAGGLPETTEQIILDEATMNADMEFIDKQEVGGEKKIADIVVPRHPNAPVVTSEVASSGHGGGHHHHHVIPDSLNKPAQRTQSLQEHHERINQRNMCRAKKYRLLRRQREKLEEFREIQEIIIKVDKDDEDDDELNESGSGLPEFTFVMSDPSLTNMSYGEKLRHELETMVRKSRIPINLDWPMTVRGFREHFKKPNAYGRIVYTMRSDNQIKATKKSSRKFKYVLHNLNYLRQQKEIMHKVHLESMQYFEVSKHKWEDALEQLLVKFLREIREAAREALDSSGRKLPKEQVDQWCHEVIRGFENLDNTAQIFHRMMNSVGITIRDLIHSESRGEGVELYEYKSLLRTNETIGAQYYRRQYDLEECKERCRTLDSVYMKTLTMKENATENVINKYQLSGELTCLLLPKQKAMKFTENKAKRLKKEHELLYLKAGIVPYPELVRDYEKTYIDIDDCRQERMDLQLKYNSRVRQVHQIYDNMEEVQRMIPETYNINWPLEFDLCGIRPKTAPAASTSKLQYTSNTSLASNTAFNRRPPTAYLTKPESHTLLVKAEETTRKLVNLRHAKSTPGIHSIKETLSRPQTAAPFGSKSSGGFMSAVPVTRPRTSVPSTGNKSSAKLSTGEVPPSSGYNLSQLVAIAEAKSREKFKRGVVTEKYPTPSKTGILPKVTPSALLKDTEPRKQKSFHGKSTAFQKQPATRPFTVPANNKRLQYESEIKHWPYNYYTKKSTGVDNSSKRQMDALIGTQGINKRKSVADPNVDETTVKEVNSKYPEMD